MTELTCFKAYDIRGRLGDELNTDVAYRIGRAYAQYLNARRVVVGGDVRATSNELKEALAQGMMDAGCDVVDLGMTGTEQVYFASFHLDVDGGIEVTASHNPIDFNGMKLVRRNAQPISGDTGLKDIKALAESGDFAEPERKGECTSLDLMPEYVEHLLGYVNLANLKPLKLVVNAGNGAAGPAVDALEQALKAAGAPVTFIKVHHEPDPTFPNGIPNPLLPENRSATADAVVEHGADMGIAWDGDFDRCFLFDEQGNFIEGYYIVGLLAEAFLRKNPGEKIIHDPRLTWNTVHCVERSGGVAVQSKTGHAFIKERMRAENAVYGGEMSAHHYFRDFAYCDSGMIPWLLVAELLCVEGVSMSQLVGERMAEFPCSGEINYKVQDVPAVLEKVKAFYAEDNPVLDTTDGVSLEFDDWRVNIRASNTEPLLRLNVESRGDADLVSKRVAEIEEIIASVG
ncbi:MAG: phosphomannomutase CpsG [Oceanospirillaceae bacterium]|nr:phosphomannomutase CpsG [Oceanospirillaceae bacterium]MAY00721.1 phosphomannomutase CpsG [Oceanospirillaceae bacterium]MBS51293.1 phosphomannomutase CpsG [Oceanospirillaceae bacterium]